jgi:hypothetical protein
MKKMKVILLSKRSFVLSFALMLTILFISCTKKKKTNEIKLSEYTYTIDSIYCPEITARLVCFQIVEDRDSIFLYFLPKNQNNISVIHYMPEKSKLYKTIKIPEPFISENLDFKDIRNLYVINKDSIIIVQQNSDLDFRFSLFNPQNDTVETLLTTNGENLIFFNADFTNFSPNFSYNSKTGDFYIDVVRNDDVEKRAKTMDTEMLYKINVRTKQFDFVNFKYPVEFNDYYFVPTADNYSYILIDDNIIFSFPYISELIKLNQTKNEISRIEMKSENEKPFVLFGKDQYENCSQEQYYDLINKTKNLSFAYTKLVWNKFDSKYYRFYELQQDSTNLDGVVNEYRDKEIGFVVYDKDFNYVQDMVIGPVEDLRDPFMKTSFASKYGIIIYNKVDLASNSLIVSRLSTVPPK